jgi:hypothetical protein
MAPLVSAPRRTLISAFILFHWACVAAWLWPNPSDVKSFLMNLRVPLPAAEARPGGEGWTFGWRPIAPAYLFHTAQHQDWAMFAPNPLQINRYVAATVTLRDGRRLEYSFPRLSQLGVIDCWLEKRYRKYQHRIAEEAVPAFREDLARFIARRSGTKENPAVRVTVYEYQSPIPRHDRARRPGWIDYTRMLRDEARFTRAVLIDYLVRPEDLG